MGRKPYERFRCSCGELVIMVPHEKTGKLAPITLATYPDGNIGINLESVNGGHGTYSVLSKQARDSDPKPRPKNHWANCPDAGSFRR